MKISNSIQTKLMVTIGASLAVIFVAGGIVLSFLSKSRFSALNTKYIKNTTERHAEEINVTFSSAYTECSSISRSIGLCESVSRYDRRKYINDILKNTLLANSEYVDAWFVSEPNAIDGLDSEYANSEGYDETGRIIPYWTNVGGKMDCTPLTDYVGSFWYENPLHSSQGVLIDPNVYELRERKCASAESPGL